MELRTSELPPAQQFLRRKVRPIARRGPLSIARLLAVLGAFLALVAAGVWSASAVRRARELSVSRIVVEGNRRIASGEILEALGLNDHSNNGRSGANILALDLPALKEQILRSAWVRDVELTRVLPATLTLRVEERVPVGIANLDRLYLMDGMGVMLDEMGPRYQDLTLPLVQGLRRGESVVQERAETAGRVLTALSREPRIEETVSEIDVSQGSRSLTVVLRNPALRLALEEEKLVPRLAAFLPIASELKERFPSVELVDLRFRDRVYLRLRPAKPRDSPEPRRRGGSPEPVRDGGGAPSHAGKGAPRQEPNVTGEVRHSEH